MKAPLFTLVFAVISTLLSAQALNSPESVTWDPVSNRYFVSNNGANQILVRSTSGIYSIFTSNISSGPHGLEIVGNTLYACDGSSVKGFDLTTASLVFNVNVGAAFLNGICTDGSNNLFATDFTAKKIFRISIAQQTFTTFVTGLARQPNGIYYDGSGGRLVWCVWGTNAPIMQALLSDSTVSQVVATTMGNCDGLVRDGAGNYYVSAWNTNTIYRFNSSFGAQTAVVTSLNSPADIYYNTVTDTLASPNSGNNTVTFHYFGTTAVNDTPGIISGLSIFPVPSRKQVTVKYEQQQAGEVFMTVSDINGKQVLKYDERESFAGKHAFYFDTSVLSPGIYLVKVFSGSSAVTQKIIVSAE